MKIAMNVVRSPLTMFGAAWILAAVLTACDSFFELTIENRQARDLYVKVGGSVPGLGRPVKMCTVDDIGATSYYGRPVQIRVNGADGQMVLETTATPSSQDSAQLPIASVVVEERWPGECSTLEVTSWRTPTAVKPSTR